MGGEAGALAQSSETSKCVYVVHQIVPTKIKRKQAAISTQNLSVWVCLSKSLSCKHARHTNNNIHHHTKTTFDQGIHVGDGVALSHGYQKQWGARPVPFFSLEPIDMDQSTLCHLFVAETCNLIVIKLYGVLYWYEFESKLYCDFRTGFSCHFKVIIWTVFSCSFSSWRPVSWWKEWQAVKLRHFFDVHTPERCTNLASRCLQAPPQRGNAPKLGDLGGMESSGDIPNSKTKYSC